MQTSTEVSHVRNKWHMSLSATSDVCRSWMGNERQTQYVSLLYRVAAGQNLPSVSPEFGIHRAFDGHTGLAVLLVLLSFGKEDPGENSLQFHSNPISIRGQPFKVKTYSGLYFLM